MLALASPVEAAFTHIATATGVSANTTTVTTGNIDTTAGGGAKLIVCSASWYSTNGTDLDATISDSASNTGWVQKTIQTGVTYSNALWYKISPSTSSSHNFTLTDSTSIYPTLSCSAFAATNTPTYEAESGFGHGTGGNTSIQPGSITPGGSDRLFVTGIVFSASNTMALDSSFSVAAQNDLGANNQGGAIGYKISVTSNAENPTWSWSAGDTTATTMATFVDSGGGGGGSTLKSLTLTGVGGLW